MVQPWKIMLIEDDEDDYILTRSLLCEVKDRQFQLDWVDSYEAGLEALRSLGHDVYLVDYRLGERDGLELVREAVAMGCRAPIILMTGQGSYAVDMEAMRIGATDYLVKGEVNGPLLERTIRYAIENKQAEEALRKAHDELELRVQERTRELAEVNASLRAEIVERQRADAALRKSETRFRTLAETTSSAIFILENNKIRYANPAVKTITGYSPEELLDQDFWVIAHPTYQEILKKNGITICWLSGMADAENSEIVTPPPSRYEIKLLTKTGQERWVDITAGEMNYEGKPALVVTAFDITERDLAEQALQKAKNQLEARVAERTEELRKANDQLSKANTQLASANEQLKFELIERQRASEEREASIAKVEVQRRLIENREMERLLIAQDLHDGPLQELIGIEYLLREAFVAANSQNASSERLLSNLIAIQTTLKREIRDLRQFCNELRPPTLAPFGLEKAIVSHMDTFQAKFPGLKVSLDLARDGKQLSEQVRLALYRIYQELLSNIVKHAGASEALVRLALDEEQVVLEVRDNGQGFEVPSQWIKLARQGHLGLVGIQERAEAMGGSVQIHSRPGEGTRVLVTVPRKSRATPSALEPAGYPPAPIPS